MTNRFLTIRCGPVRGRLEIVFFQQVLLSITLSLSGEVDGWLWYVEEGGFRETHLFSLDKLSGHDLRGLQLVIGLLNISLTWLKEVQE